MTPLLRKAPFDKEAEKASPDTGCKIIYSSSSPHTSSLRFSGLDSPEGKGGWLWRSHASDPDRKIAFIYLDKPAGEKTYVADSGPGKKRRGGADGR